MQPPFPQPPLPRVPLESGSAILHPSGAPLLRFGWIEGAVPKRALLASLLWHTAVILMIPLPIWKFLFLTPASATGEQTQITWYGPVRDLPPLILRASPIKKVRLPRAPRSAARVELAFHPRQTILSMPAHLTHPRQTLLQPEAPAAPPKIEPSLPNIVEWKANSAPASLKIHIAPSAVGPLARRRTVREAAAPEVVNTEKPPGELNLATSAEPVLRARIRVTPGAPPVASQRTVADTATAPEILHAESNAPGIGKIVALSAEPALPAPNVTVPNGNLAARFNMGPEGKSDSTGGGTDSAKGTKREAGNGIGEVGVRIASGESATRSSVATPGNSLNLDAEDGASQPRRGESHISSTLRPTPITLPPGAVAEVLLGGKRIYTLNINMPNLTSATGSWILRFSQLDEDDGMRIAPAGVLGELSSPVPLRKADPQYPPGLRAEHVEGEVVLFAIIRKDGSVDSIQLVHGLDPQLDRNAMEALARWQFRPGARDGKPVDIEAIVHIPFRTGPRF